MHNAPAVSFPVGRSYFHAGLLGSVALLGALTLWGWMMALEALQMWSAGALLLWLAGIFWAGLAWWRSPKGSLVWDGQKWAWTGQTHAMPVELVVLLDTQNSLLLCLQTGASRIWIWPEQRMQSVRWLGLRRAVFAHKSSRPGLDQLRSSV